MSSPPRAYGSDGDRAHSVRSPRCLVDRDGCPIAADASWEVARRRLVQARDLVRRGRHAKAARQLRAAEEALTRRRDWAGAGQAALALGRLLRERGLTRAARDALERAGRHFGAAGTTAGAIEAAIHMSGVLLDEARFAESEAVIRGALLAAERGCAEAASRARLQLANVLHWLGSHAEARLMVRAVEDAVDLRVPRLSLAARLAIAERDFPKAASLATEALESVGDGTAVEAELPARLVMAEVHRALGEREGLARHVAAGIRAARAAHRPLDALEFRVMQLEGLLAAGCTREAQTLARRLSRSPNKNIPARLRQRLHVALADAAGTAARSKPRRPGGPSRTWAREGVPPPASHDLPPADVLLSLVEVLDICNDTEDEDWTLTRVCAALRQRLRAASVGCVGKEEGTGVLASAGAPLVEHLPSARRAMDAGLPIPPGRYTDTFEAAVPVPICGERDCRSRLRLAAWSAD